MQRPFARRGLLPGANAQAIWIVVYALRESGRNAVGFNHGAHCCAMDQLLDASDRHRTILRAELVDDEAKSGQWLLQR